MRRLVVVAAGVAAVLAVVGVVLVEVNGADFETADATGAAVLAISFVTVGAVIAAARNHPVGWVMVVSGCFNAVNAFTGQYSTLALDHGLPLRATSAWLSAWVWVGGAVGFPLVLLLFPTGRPPSPRWRLLVWLTSLSAVVIGVATAVAAWALSRRPIDAPRLYELLPDDGPMWVADGMVPVLGMCLIAAAISLIFRYRGGGHTERQQIKWLFVAGLAVTFVLFTASPSAPVDLSDTVPLLGEFALLALAAIPTAIGMAILRYRLYDIDIVINRALVYGALTAILGALYAGSVFGLQSLLSPVTSQSDLAVAASTLVVAALFGPLRRRVQAFIDRRFYRKKVDAQETVERFTHELRDEVDLGALSSRLVTVVADTMQPAHVSLWFKEAR